MKPITLVMIVIVVAVILYLALKYLPSRTYRSCAYHTSYGIFYDECPDLTVVSRPRYRIVRLNLFGT